MSLSGIGNFLFMWLIWSKLMYPQPQRWLGRKHHTRTLFFSFRLQFATHTADKLYFALFMSKKQQVAIGLLEGNVQVPSGQMTSCKVCVFLWGSWHVRSRERLTASAANMCCISASWLSFTERLWLGESASALSHHLWKVKRWKVEP